MKKKKQKIRNVTDLVSRRPKTTLLPILVNAGGFIFSFRLEASLAGAIVKIENGNALTNNVFFLELTS